MKATVCTKYGAPDVLQLQEVEKMVDTYRFRVKGQLNDRWSDWLEGMAAQRQEDGTTVLVGPIVDQAALHGVIIRIRDLGLPLLSLRRVAEAHGGT